MKDRKLLYLGIVILVVILIELLMSFMNNKLDDQKVADGLTEVKLKAGIVYDSDLEHIKVFGSYKTFSLYFNSETINEQAFNNNNYAIIVLTYDECKYTNVVPAKFKIYGNNINVTAYHDGCSSCQPLYAYYAVRVDKKKTEMYQRINWIARNKSECK